MDGILRHLDEFYAFSAIVTGHTVFELKGTGMGETYWTVVKENVGEEILLKLLQIASRVLKKAREKDDPQLEEWLREAVDDNPSLQEAIGGIIKLWYLGIWDGQDSGPVRRGYAISKGDTTQVVSPMAYTEGLVWSVIGAHPMGALEQGYGAWSEPPRVNVCLKEGRDEKGGIA